MTEHRMKNNGSGPVIITALVMVLLFSGFAFFLVTQGQGIPNVEEDRAQIRFKNLADLNSENQKVLAQYRWVDKNKGVVGIPIDRAMQLLRTESQKYPTRLEFRMALANVEVRAQKFDLAVAEYNGLLDKVDRKSATAADLYVRLGTTLSYARNLPAAIDACGEPASARMRKSYNQRSHGQVRRVRLRR